MAINGDNPGESRFTSVLRSLHEISLELSTMPDAETLCRRAVEWGLANLGLDRMSLWFIDQADPEYNLGTWGTDESGRIRDERGARVRRDPGIAPPGFYEGGIPAFVSRDRPCYDEARNIVGKGDTALAPLWDGRHIIGELSADNLINHRPIDDEDLDLLVLYARIIAHLYSILKSREAAAAASESRKVLLRELRHRTKNSLALIGSLISLEAGRLADSEAESALSALSSRVEALALLYSILDVDPGSEGVDLVDYLGTIARSLARAHGADAKGVQVELALEPLRVGSELAAPLGLALNELLVDSLKYAFPGGRRGTIRIELSVAEELCLLVVSDDGIGLPSGIESKAYSGFGLGLVELLAAQIGGDFKAVSAGGCRFEIRFPGRKPPEGSSPGS